jgi:eukaryotic translation initiation factor 2C
MATPAFSAEVGTALTVWSDRNHEFYYPVAAGATVPGHQNISYNNLVGRAWDQTTADKHLATMAPAIKMTYRKTVPSKFPLQKKLACLDAEIQQTILSNHFELKVHDTTLYEYEILDLELEGQTRKKTQALFRKAIAQWTFLMNDQASFATDGQKTIVSWKPLHGSMDSSKLIPSSAGPSGVGSIWEEDISTGRATSFTARFKYAGPVNIPDLMAQTRCDLSKVNADLSAVERCINILISKSFNNSVIKSSGKKFFVRSARNDLQTSQSLEIIRGYYYAVRPSIGSLLVNFNVATSAFFKPILVSTFLSDGQTFSNPAQRLSLLKRLRVYVEYQHSEECLNKMGSRLKMIHALGDPVSEKIETLYFHKKLLDADGKPYKLPNGDWARETTRTMVVKHHRDGKCILPVQPQFYNTNLLSVWSRRPDRPSCGQCRIQR